MSTPANRVMDHTTFAYLARSLTTFLYDPPDTDFQRGYREALIVMGRNHAGAPEELRALARLVDPNCDDLHSLYTSAAIHRDKL